MKKQLATGILSLFFICGTLAEEKVITPTGGDDSSLIQNALDALQTGDTLRLVGDFMHNKTIYLGSDFTWILEGTLTLSKYSSDELDDYGLVYEGFDNSRSTAIATREGAKNIDMSGGIIYGNGDYNGSASGLPRVRQVNMVFAENCYFHDFTVEDASDDCFTLGAASHHNKVERVIGRHAGGKIEKDGGNALTDVGHHNTWIDCIADQGGSDGWTPKCRYSTFIRCIASNNDGPGFGMYAREEGYSGNKDVGAHIIGNKFIDCIAYGSKGSSGFSLNISSNCPAAIIRDNYIQTICYDNKESGVVFRNKDDAEQGIIENNVVDIICYGNQCLNKSGNINSWAGGLGIENDNSSVHNTVENITGSVICYDNVVDVNTRGGHNCNIKVFHPEEESNPILVDQSAYNNTVSVIEFSCSGELGAWSQHKYCGVSVPEFPNAPNNLTANVVSSRQIDLNWEDTIYNEEGFIVERKTSGPYILIATVDANVSSFSDTNVFSLTGYDYRVRAFNSGGYSDYSNIVSAVSEASTRTIVPTGGNDDSDLIQSTLDQLQAGDTIILKGDFILGATIYLPSNITWILDGSLTVAADADLDIAGYFEGEIDARRRTGITEKVGGATNIDMSGGTYYGNSASYPSSMRYLNFGSVTHSRFHDMLITEVTDDNFTLGPGCNNNECRNLVGSYSKTGNAMTDKGDHNTWIDCVAEFCLGPDGDGWTPKCRYSTFIRCIAANNGGPGFGMYAREEGQPGNIDVGAQIIGNTFLDCVSYGSVNGSGFSFNISSNCPGAIIRDNFIQAICYDNHGSGVTFRNKDDAELGIIENNEVDLICFGNKGLNKSGSSSSWAGGLGMENDNSDTHNLIENISGSVICYDNKIDVNTKGGHNCNITVYHPSAENAAILEDKSANNNTLTVIDFSCSDPLETWCQQKYCDLYYVPPPIAPSDLTAEAFSSSQIDLSWTDNSEDEEGFVIEQKSGDEFVVLDTVEANISTFSSTGLDENTVYTFRVRALSQAGYSDYTNEIQCETEASGNTMIRTKASAGSDRMSSYPNPFQTICQLDFELLYDCQVSIKLYDSFGREICELEKGNRQTGQNTAFVHAAGLAPGTYYCRLCAGSAVYTEKLLLLP